MLALMAMRWNKQKVNNLATALSRRYQKVIEIFWSVTFSLIAVFEAWMLI